MGPGARTGAPHRFVMSWYPARTETVTTELEVRFSPEGDGTRVDLEHAAGRSSPRRLRRPATNYDGGWAHVLDCYERKLNG